MMVRMRVVSLLPSATEIVYALGLGADLVGVTFECDEPPAARVDKTVVVGGRDTRGMTPAQIDAYVTGNWQPAAICTPCTPMLWPAWSRS
jgi:iron complex transport system substrate-binding protein